MVTAWLNRRGYVCSTEELGCNSRLSVFCASGSNRSSQVKSSQVGWSGQVKSIKSIKSGQVQSFKSNRVYQSINSGIQALGSN